MRGYVERLFFTWRLPLLSWYGLLLVGRLRRCSISTQKLSLTLDGSAWLRSRVQLGPAALLRVSCLPHLLPAPALVLTVLLLLHHPALARESGIQGTPDGKQVLVNKDVGGERYAISQDQADGAATGNVFFATDRPPSFLFCTPTTGRSLSCSIGSACHDTTGRASGIQRRPDGRGILVNKDSGQERFAITKNSDDGTLTGNVFFADGQAPKFVFCQPRGGGETYDCSVADRCVDDACPPYAALDQVVLLPPGFFTPPPDCPEYEQIGNVDLPPDFFRLPGTSCGDGLRNGAEECDASDSERCPLHACHSDCTCERCGNGVRDASEQCDGNDSALCALSACRQDCTCEAACGDGIRNGQEQCDGGDNAGCSGQPCTAACTCPVPPVGCGNGVREILRREECDGEDRAACGARPCGSDCKCVTVCGDGIQSGTEECDGNDKQLCGEAACSSDCQCVPLPSCNDGIQQADEFCDNPGGACAAYRCRFGKIIKQDTGGGAGCVPFVGTCSASCRLCMP